MFTYIIKVTICWLVFYLVYSAFLKKETFFNINRWYLLATLLLGAGIPLLEFLPIFQEDNIAVAYFQPLNEGVFFVQSTVNDVVTKSSFGWTELFWSVYLAGIVIFGMRFFIGLGKIYKLYRSAEIVTKENHTLVLTNKVHLPFSFFKLMFWSKKLEFNINDGEKIITHEEAHVKGWHSVDVMLLEMMSIIFWCSPMVYIYKKSLKTVHEYLADAVVLQTTPTKKYGHLLLQQSQSGLQIALANHFIHSQLKQRIIMMTRNKSRKEAIIKYLFALPVILLLVIAFSKKEALANMDIDPIEIVETNNFDNLNSVDNIKSYLEQEVDEMPRFPGCENEKTLKEKEDCSNIKLLTHIYTNIKYPSEARKAGIQGKVIIKFVVKKDGSITHARVAKEIGGGCGESALGVINRLPKMVAGMKDGKNVDTEMLIPVSFKLADDDCEDCPDDKNEKKSTEQKDNGEPFFKVVDEMPEFPGCEDELDASKRKKCAETKMLTYIYSNIKYPAEARDADIQGRVIVQLIIQKDGSVGDIKILRDIGGGCAEEVERVIGSMPNWTPGKQDGKAVNVQYTLPVQFKLEGDAKSNDKLSLESDNNKKPLVILDGENFDHDKMGDLDPDDIATINVFKGEDAIAEYGDAGKDGVIVVITKKAAKNARQSLELNTEDKDPLYILEGEVITRAEMEQLDPDDIATINVSKGKKAIEKYGDAGKNGVVIITLKKRAKRAAKKAEKKNSKKLKFNSGDKNKKPHYVLDGEVIDHAEMEELNSNEIAEMSVLKGEKAIEKYGDKGKYGVIEIISKKAAKDNPENLKVHPIKKKNALEQAGLTYVNVSPNPTSGRLNIEYGSQDKPMTIQIMDVNGKEIFRKEVIGGRSSLQDIDVSQAAKGMLLITFQQDGKVYTEKVILQ